jgi:hypothetical protein
MAFKKKGNKYGAKKVHAYGIKFDSTKEFTRYNQLRLLKKSGAVKDFEHQVPFIYEHEGKKMFKYIADYVVTYPDGRKEVEDVKAFDKKTQKFLTTPLFKLKKKLIEAKFKIEIKLV